MKRILFIIAILSLSINAQTTAPSLKSTSNFAFENGEWLRFRMSYSNFLNAGYATISVNGTSYNGKKAFHINGKGKSTGLVNVFFKVRDNYQSYIYKETLQPYRFIRDIHEGGYTKNREINFDHTNKLATVTDKKKNTIKKYPISNNIQDILSALYFLRNKELTNLQKGQEVELNMFFDNKVNDFKLRFLGKETIRTKFGKVRALKFRPYVKAGRVFKAQESVTVWVSDDENKIPLRVKASLAVGSLRADLDAYKGLAHPFNIIFNN